MRKGAASHRPSAEVICVPSDDSIDSDATVPEEVPLGPAGPQHAALHPGSTAVVLERISSLSPLTQPQKAQHLGMADVGQPTRELLPDSHQAHVVTPSTAACHTPHAVPPPAGGPPFSPRSATHPRLSLGRTVRIELDPVSTALQHRSYPDRLVTPTAAARRIASPTPSVSVRSKGLEQGPELAPETDRSSATVAPADPSARSPALRELEAARALLPDVPAPLVPLALPVMEAAHPPPTVAAALKGLFPRRFTPDAYLRAATRVIGAENVLRVGEFWSTFASTEFVGEGAFGFVWKCQLHASPHHGGVALASTSPRRLPSPREDPDSTGQEPLRPAAPFVAVKSCPISFECPEAIDDGFSVLREIAIMKTLAANGVRNVLPILGAYYCAGDDCLPPAVSAALARQSVAGPQGKSSVDVNPRNLDDCVGRKPRLGRGQKTKKLPSKRARSPPPERAAEAVVPPVRLPTFAALSNAHCGASVFLVMPLCDGDVDSLPVQNEAVTRGVGISVGAALADIHQLGLIHLDVKPQNILYVKHDAANPTYKLGVPDSRPGMSEAASVPPAWWPMHGAAPPHRTRREAASPMITEADRNEPRSVPASANCALVHSAMFPHGDGESRRAVAVRDAIVDKGGLAGGIVRHTTPTAAGGSTSLRFFLADFGNARPVGLAYEDTVDDAIGTYEYMDARALERKVCSRATDAYSLGATLYQLLTGRFLYSCRRRHQCHDRECYVEEAKKPLPPAAPGAQMSTVVLALLDRDGHARITCEESSLLLLERPHTRAYSSSDP